MGGHVMQLMLPRKPNRWVFPAVSITAVILLATIAWGMVIILASKRPAAVTAPERYSELQFAVLHRPHVTYFVDRRYRLCFATRKPDYQDLVQFDCSERLLVEATAGLSDQVTAATDGGRPRD